MQVSKLLVVVALVCVVFVSGAGADEMMSAAGATAVPRALLRASVLPAALSHTAPDETPPIDCCKPQPRWCCVAAPAVDSDGSP
jgi:hypothetical protein